MNKLLKSSILLFIITILSKILGFFRETTLVSFYGASSIADVYLTTMNIPGVVFSIIGAAISTTFIPLFFEIKNNKGNQKSLDFVNNTFNIIILLSILLAIVGYIFAEPLVKVFAIDFTGEKLLLATRFTRIMIFCILFIGLNSILISWMQINENFSIPALIGIPYNIVIIISIFISSNNNLDILAIGTLIATFSQFIFLIIFSYKKNYRYKLYINVRDEYIRKMIYLTLPVIIGVGINQINTIVDMSLASSLDDGFITILNSASKLNGLVITLFVSTVTTIIYPLLSKLANEDNEEQLIETIKKSINIIIILIIPVSVGSIVLSKPIVRIVFERGMFSEQSTELTALALIAYSIGTIGFALRNVLNRVFYSFGDTKTPMLNATLSMVMNIILNLILIKFLGHIGLALASSISALICVILLFNSLKKRVEFFGQDEIIKTTIKCIIASSIMGLGTYFTYKYLIDILGFGTIQDFVSLIVAIIGGILIYLVLITFLKIEEINIILDRVKSKYTIKLKNDLVGVKND